MPAQSAPIAVARPLLPPADAIIPYVQQIDKNAWYSNHGPLARSFQARLGEHWGVGTLDIALVSNATVGLTLALIASGAKKGQRCLMPSWTFVASAGAVVAAGLIPHFVDVSPSTWAPDPSELERLAARPDIGAILVVSPFGAPLDLAVWDRLQQRTGLPVIIDGAAAFDTLRAGGPMTVGTCPVVVSLHATKVFGVGEGGAVIARDPDLAARIRALAQFGFAGTRDAKLPGGNAKISEYTAAVGLAGLDTWDETRARWQRVTDAYLARLPQSLGLPPQFGAQWVSSTLTVLWPDNDPTLEQTLAAAGVAALRWWGPGCHAHQAYCHFPREDLPVTAIYAPRAIGLPFWQELTDTQISTVIDCVHRVLPHRDRDAPAATPVAAALVEASR